MTGPSLEVVAGRSWVVAEGRRLGPVGARATAPHQLVVKVVGRAKSPRAVRCMALYMGRWTAECRANGLFGAAALADEGGNVLRREDLPATLAAWRLIRDPDNLTSRARRLGADAALLRERDRLKHAQAVHLTWSVNGEAEPPGPGTRRALANATLAAMDELFSRRGYRGLWAIHDEHPAPDARRAPDRRAAVHPHVHILVPTLSAAGDALVVDRNFLDDARAVIARHARREGLNVTAERREDRPEVRERVIAGEERLRKSWRRGQTRDGRSGLATHAPLWFVRHGAGYERRRAALRLLRTEAREMAARESGRAQPPGKAVDRHFQGLLPAIEGVIPRFRRIEPALRPLALAVAGSFVDAAAAARSFAELAREGGHVDATRGVVVHPNRARAEWYMRNNPLVFGALSRGARRHRRDVALIKAMRALRLEGAPEIRIPDDVRVEAIAASAAAAARTAGAARDRGTMVASLRELAEQTEKLLGSSSRGETIRRVAADLERRRPGVFFETPARGMRGAAEEARREKSGKGPAGPGSPEALPGIAPGGPDRGR